MPETEPTLTEADAEHIETARLAQRQKNIALTAVAEMAHMVLGKRCVGDDDADCWVIADLIVISEWLKDHVAAARREALLEARDYLSEQEQFDAAELVRTMVEETA